MAVNPGLVQYGRFVGHGEVDIDATAEALPSVAGKIVYLKALSSNSGSIFIGNSDSVTASDGSTDTTTGYELDAGQELGPFPLVDGNLNTIYAIGGAANQVLTYMVFA